MLNETNYLRDVQYRDASNLDARARLHRKYGRGDWFPWLASQIEWPRGVRVLEIGCGAGWFWEAASTVLPVDLNITLNDLSPGMVAEAAARVRSLRRDWIVSETTADAMSLPFEDAAYDIVLASHMLYHLPDPAVGVAEMARVLKPGGVALAATNGRVMLREIFAIQVEVWPGQAIDPAHLAFGLENGGATLEAVFESVELHRYADDLRCTDPTDVEAYLTSSPPGANAEPGELQRLRRTVEAAFGAADGVLTVTKDVGVFLCRQPRDARKPRL